MSDSSRPPYPSRKSGRAPATIDLRASEVTNETPRAETAEAAADPVTEPAAVQAASEAAETATSEPTVSAAESAAEPRAETAATDEDAMISQAAEEAARETPVAAPPPPPRRRGGFASLLAASIIGGIIGAGGTFLADHYWQRQRGADPALQARLAQLDERTAGVARQDAVRGVEQRVATVASDLGKLNDRVQAAEAAAKAASERVDEAVNRPAGAAGTPAPVASTPAPQADTAAVDALSARIEALEARLRERGEANASAAQSATQSAQTATQTAETATQTAQTAAKQAQSAAQAARTVEGRLTDLDRRLGDVSKQAAQRTAEATASVKIAASTRLVEALREGAPYAPVLAALKSAGADPARLAPLEPYAQSGAPTAAALRRDFAPVADRIRREGQPPPADLSDRLWRVLDKVVTVRPVEGAGSGEGVPAILVTIDDALSRGAVAQAASAWDKLPEPARRVSEDFARRLKQRAAAEEAARTLSAEALSGLDSPSRPRS